MKLLTTLLEHLQGWAEVMPQERTLNRLFTVGIGILCGVGKRTITRAIGFHGNTQKDWSADYKLFSRSPWKPQALFAPILREAISHYRLERIVVSVDDTRIWRTGQHVPQTQWHRDPLGPAFHANLRWGHRFLQASLVLPLYREQVPGGARSLPVRWEMAPVVKKPGKRATDQQWEAYAKEKKEKNLSRQFVSLVSELRRHLNDTGQADKTLVVVGDGSFCNRTVLAEDWPAQNVSLVVRCRKDIVLCKRAREKGRRFFGKTKFTPEQVRRWDGLAPWQQTLIFHGGQRSLGPVQGNRGALLAKRGQTETPALDRAGFDGLPQKQEQQKAIPQTGLSVDHRPAHGGGHPDPGLLRPLGHRSQSSRREGSPRRGRSASLEPRIGPQSARLGSGPL